MQKIFIKILFTITTVSLFSSLPFCMHGFSPATLDELNELEKTILNKKELTDRQKDFMTNHLKKSFKTPTTIEGAMLERLKNALFYRYIHPNVHFRSLDAAQARLSKDIIVTLCEKGSLTNFYKSGISQENDLVAPLTNVIYSFYKADGTFASDIHDNRVRTRSALCHCSRFFQEYCIKSDGKIQIDSKLSEDKKKILNDAFRSNKDDPLNANQYTSTIANINAKLKYTSSYADEFIFKIIEQKPLKTHSAEKLNKKLSKIQKSLIELKSKLQNLSNYLNTLKNEAFK